MSGLLDRARTTLTDLDREVPHHPLILPELARVDLARGDWAAIERLAKPERAQQRDSLLMATELMKALERQGRPREAADVLIEAWATGPAEEWAGDSLVHLAEADPRGVREALRNAVRRLPWRSDMTLTACTLEWRGGDPREPLRRTVVQIGRASCRDRV